MLYITNVAIGAASLSHGIGSRHDVLTRCDLDLTFTNSQENAMAMAVAPRTPKPQIAEPAFSTPSPGTWRHPKFDEIARRQGQNIFDESNVRRIIWNGGALFILWVVDSFIG